MSYPRVQRAAADNEFYTAALEQLPGYQQAHATAEQAEQLLRELISPSMTLPSPLSTGIVTGEWLDAVAAHRQALSDLEARRAALIELRDTARATLASLPVLYADIMLGELNAALAPVISTGREICAGLHGASTPREVLDAGTDAVRAWSNLAPVVARYAKVRAAQFAVMAEFSDETQMAKSTINTDRRASDLLVANLDEISPSWRNPARDYNGNLMWSAPWPADDTEYFVWLVTSDARPWVPTLAQLDQQHRDRADPIQGVIATTVIDNPLTTTSPLGAPA
ncbi:hypothetical protein [Nocardia sp. NPDC059239]|uniref:hypothetical protein n=1 Tax=Nocardia sp. NPDC059239 TaxID=3346785 RepID=UPI0036C93DE8